MKFAMKLPQLNRSWLMLAGAVALGIVATGLTHKLLKDRMAALEAAARISHPTIELVVASQDLPRGAKIEGRLFERHPIPVEYASASAIDPKHFGQFVGQKLGAPLKRGEVLLAVDLESTTQVFSNTLENGNRALTTEVDEVNSISGMLRPTDHIDLMATARGTGSNSKEVTFALLSNVQVLATGQVTRKRDGSDKPHTYTTITLSVSPDDAERIVVAKNSGRLTAVLRNPDDAQPNAIKVMSIDDVVPKKPKAADQFAVQYIVGGRS